MTSIPHTAEREAFERWYAQAIDGEHFGVYEDPDEPESWIYLERDVASAWYVWQARAALGPVGEGGQPVAAIEREQSEHLAKGTLTDSQLADMVMAPGSWSLEVKEALVARLRERARNAQGEGK